MRSFSSREGRGERNCCRDQGSNRKELVQHGSSLWSFGKRCRSYSRSICLSRVHPGLNSLISSTNSQVLHPISGWRHHSVPRAPSSSSEICWPCFHAAPIGRCLSQEEACRADRHLEILLSKTLSSLKRQATLPPLSGKLPDRELRIECCAAESISSHQRSWKDSRSDGKRTWKFISRTEDSVPEITSAGKSSD